MSLLFLTLLLLSSTVSSNLQTVGEVARYRINAGGDLLIDTGTCILVTKQILDTANSNWQPTPFGLVNGNSCAGISWTVKPNGDRPTRPTYYYRNQKFIDTGDRVDIGAPCSGPQIKPCKRCDTRMLVQLSPKTYASCVSN